MLFWRMPLDDVKLDATSSGSGFPASALRGYPSIYQTFLCFDTDSRNRAEAVSTRDLLSPALIAEPSLAADKKHLKILMVNHGAERRYTCTGRNVQLIDAHSNE